ncbi:MAG: DUF547 domain-containing protein [Deltaproteobacteria bacterium]|jgi:hypothetical protein|nr:DUF547 domain-containing protein [Deltaproteobacteria bacterium]
MPNVKTLVLITLFMLSGPAAILEAYGAPAAELWPRWQTHDPNSVVIVDHANWGLLLRRYVVANHPSGINRFRYSSVSAGDHQALKNYLRMMQAVSVSALNRNEQKAYWINLYNALTVDVILDHYPIKTIRDIDISPGFFSNGPWDAKLLTIEGQKVSLNDIEHRILRPVWSDNRVHYAVNCASLGCPNLQPQPFTSHNLDMLLEKAARDYINHPRGLSFPSGKPRISSIYVWFKEDFGGSEEGIILHLEKYLTPEKLEELAAAKKKMSHHYDWDLNE